MTSSQIIILKNVKSIINVVNPAVLNKVNVKLNNSPVLFINNVLSTNNISNLEVSQ